MRRLLLILAAAVLLPPAWGAAPDAPKAPAAEAVSPAEKKVLDQIQQLKGQQWRVYGSCRYSWGRWRTGDNDVRLTDVQCGPEWAQKGSVAVHCATLRLNRKMGEGEWEVWRFPLTADESSSSGGEDRMVAALCANLMPAAEPAPAQAVPAPAAPTSTPAAAPAPKP